MLSCLDHPIFLSLNNPEAILQEKQHPGKVELQQEDLQKDSLGYLVVLFQSTREYLETLMYVLINPSGNNMIFQCWCYIEVVW